MRTLSAERCVACRRDSPRVTATEIADLKHEIPDWQLLDRDGIARLERVFHFPTFADALAFTNRVGALARPEADGADGADGAAGPRGRGSDRSRRTGPEPPRRVAILIGESRDHVPRAYEEAVMTLDVPLLRSDTPGVANVLHFNNAGAALPPRPVLDAVTSHLAREAAIGGYEAAAEAADRLADVYEAVATLIRARPDEIPVVGNATRPWGMAFLP